nr:matrixin family metalloprotease [Dyella sp. ASV21]
MNGDYVDINSGAKNDVVAGVYDTIHDLGTGTFTVDGALNVVTGSDDQVTINGSDTLDLSHCTIDVSGNDHVTINGSDDNIIGSAGDNFTITGTGDDVQASDASITFDGSNSGDYVSGSGDTGSNWDDPSGGTGDPDPGSGYYGYGLTTWGSQKPSAAQIAKAEQSDSVYENAAWADKTITWSFANSGEGISKSITDSEQQAEVKQAFQAWAVASGLNFEEVATGSQADIEIGFGGLNTASTNEIGLTRYGKSGGNLASAVVELEDPSQAPLAKNGNGRLAYAETNATFEQVAMHEIGHALGLADTDVAGSIMNAVLGSANQAMGASDLANVQHLYAGITNEDVSTVAQVQQLVQAMNTFDAGVAGVDGYSLAQAESLLQNGALLSSYGHAHAA